MLSSPVLGQYSDPDIEKIIERERLVLKDTKRFITRSPRNNDSLITFYSDTLVFRFSLGDMAHVKMKGYRSRERREERCRNAIAELRTGYKNGIDSIQIDSMSMNLEALVWGYLLRSGKVNEITINGTQVSIYTCKSYSRDSKEETLFYALYDESTNCFWGYSSVACWGIRLRE